MKSNIPWPPGSIPVMNVAQATGLWGGITVSRCLNSPSWRSLSRYGRESQWRPRKLGSMPSMPNTTTLLVGEFASDLPHPVKPSTNPMSITPTAHCRRPLVIPPSSCQIEYGAAFHPGRPLHAKQFEHRGRHVFNARVLGLDLAIRKEHSRNQHGVDRMIATPCLAVVLENPRCHPAYRGVPRRAVAVAVPYNEVWRFSQIRPSVEGTACVDVLNPDGILLLVPEIGELPDQFLLEGLGFRSRFHRALCFATLQIKV